MRQSMVSAFLAFLLVGCGVLDARSSAIVVYGRNAQVAEAWFALMPGPASGGAVGFGRDMGVACLNGPVGSDLVSLSASPTKGGVPVQVIAKLNPADAAVPSVWVDVQPDGSLQSGNGVPAWWVDEPPSC